MSDTTPTGPEAPSESTAEPTTEAPKAKPSARFEAPKDAEGSDRKALYDRTEGRFVTGPGEPGKGAPAFDKVKGHTYATVKV